MTTVSGQARADDVTIRVDISSKRIYVGVDGKPTHAWQAASGRIDHETPTGKFRVTGMEVDGYSQKYDAPMPHAIYFKGQEYAIHGYAGRRLGQSHGCVRISKANATKLYELVRKNKQSTKIYIE